MKKLLAILLSAMLVFSMVACSNDTPSPQAPVETPTELDKINDKMKIIQNKIFFTHFQTSFSSFDFDKLFLNTSHRL